MGGARVFVVVRGVAVHFQPVVSSTERVGVADIGVTTIYPRNPMIDITREHVATRPDTSSPTLAGLSAGQLVTVRFKRNVLIAYIGGVICGEDFIEIEMAE